MHGFFRPQNALEVLLKELFPELEEHIDKKT